MRAQMPQKVRKKKNEKRKRERTIKKKKGEGKAQWPIRNFSGEMSFRKRRRLRGKNVPRKQRRSGRRD